jgi:hypothetical protein
VVESLITLPCTLVGRTESDSETDDYGKPLVEEDSTETVCYLEQRQRDEEGNEGETSTSDWLAAFLPDEDVDTASALIQAGRVFEFVGAPWPVQDVEAGNVSHIEATVRFTGREEDS